MNCEKVQSSISAFLDRKLPESERDAMSMHFSACRDCANHYADLEGLRSTLRAMPRMHVPKALASRLAVVASYEIARRQGNHEFSSRFSRWWMRVQIIMRDMMRPVALPAAGGVLSSFVFFVMLVNTFAFQPMVANDTPLAGYKQVTVDDLSPFGYAGRDLVVELTIDKTGHVAGYSVQHGVMTADEIRQLGNLLLFTSFEPATALGQPTSGKVLINTHHINVRG